MQRINVAVLGRLSVPPNVELRSCASLAMNRDPSANIFKQIDVSKDVLTVENKLAVRKALIKVRNRITEIGRSLAIEDQQIQSIIKLHGTNVDRQTIAIIDTWLRQNYDKSRKPYNIEGNMPHPSWWSLVWAVAQRTGGSNPAEAMKIARNYKSFYLDVPKQSYPDVDDNSFSMGNANGIANEVQDVWHLWYEIGDALNIPTSTLDQISGTLEDSFTEMIKTWITHGINFNSPTPCWRSLVEVVHADYGGRNPALANLLAKYYRGPKIVEQEMDTEPSSSTIDNQGGSVQGRMSTPVQPPAQGTATTTRQSPIVTAKQQNEGGKVASDSATEEFDLETNNGIAILVSSQYLNSKKYKTLKGTQNDLKKMKDLFTGFGIQCIHRQESEATKENILSLCERLNSDLNEKYKEPQEDKEDKVLIFYFAGHGSSNDVIISDDDKEITIGGEIAVNFLNIPGLVNVPKLFFIDACRGQHKVLQPRGGADKPETPNWLVENCLFAYATIPEHVTYGTEQHGLWTRALIKCFNVDDDDNETDETESLSTILDEVAKEVKGNEKLSEDNLVLQPQYVSQLRGAFRFRKPKPKPVAQ